MIRKIYIARREDRRFITRVIDYHDPDDKDLPAEKAMYARHPHIPHLAIDLGEDEVQFDHDPTSQELEEAFPDDHPQGQEEA